MPLARSENIFSSAEFDYLLQGPDDRADALNFGLKVVQDDHALWIVKFGRQDDRWDNPRVEHGPLKLARTCGLNATNSRVETIAGRTVLLTDEIRRASATRRV